MVYMEILEQKRVPLLDVDVLILWAVLSNVQDILVKEKDMIVLGHQVVRIMVYVLKLNKTFNNFFLFFNFFIFQYYI